MRVPSLSVYMSSTQRLRTLASDLNDANLVVSSQRRINSPSDDPIGISQTLDLNTRISNLVQFKRNSEAGAARLDAAESALKSATKQILEMRVLANQMVNASVSAKERTAAADQVQKAMDQLLLLGNSRLNGNYIFSGDKTEMPAFAKNNANQVIYQGSQSGSSVVIGAEQQVETGLVGGKIFFEKEIKVDSTNNKVIFKEDNGQGMTEGRVLETSIPPGKYTPDKLALAVRNAMNEVSENKGYKVKYSVAYDAENKRFTLGTTGNHKGYMKTEMLYKAGDIPQISGVSGDGLERKNIKITSVNEKALTRHTTVNTPFTLTYAGKGKWRVSNDPGYGLPKEISGNDKGVSLDLDKDGTPDLKIALDTAAKEGNAVKFEINSATSDRSVIQDMGFSGDMELGPIRSNTKVNLKTIDATNNVIDFKETTADGTTRQLSAAIPPGKYTDMKELAKAVEKSMENASENKIDYSVRYDAQTRKFTIAAKGNKATDVKLLWKTGTHQASAGAGKALGFDVAADDVGATSHDSDNRVALIKVTSGVNDTINFKEVGANGSVAGTDELTAKIPPGEYSDMDAFAKAVERAMEKASAEKGKKVDYEVTYDVVSKKLCIKQDGSGGERLKSLHLLWGSGSDKASSAAGIMGFENRDVADGPPQGKSVKWGIFKTLSDLKIALKKNDTVGIQRSMTRLENHYESMTSSIANLGIKSKQVSDTETLNTELKLMTKKRKSQIEDADMVESLMHLKAVENAYKVSMQTTAKVLKMSLMDFL